jgi:hypothetical protein
MSSPRPRDRAFAVARWGIVLLFLLALFLGVTRRGFDFDEIEHAHSSWLVSAGERPFHDFFECHPPFVWYLFAPVASAIRSPLALLLVLRTISVLGNLVFLALLLANMSLGEPERQSRFLAVMLAACAPANLEYLLELRIDSWAIAGLLAAILLLRLKRPARPFLRYALFSAVGLLCSLACPKIAVLAVLVCAVELWSHWRDGVVIVTAYVAGAAVGLSAAAGFLLAVGINPVLAYRLTISFHALFVKGTTFHVSLPRALLDQPLLLGLCVAGAVVWLMMRRRNTFEIAVFVHLAVQLATVPFPYKQYYAPWLLLGATFIPFVLDLARRLSPAFRETVAWLLVLVTASFALAAAARFANADGVDAKGAYLAAVRELKLPADARVVAPITLHPVTMKDASYASETSVDPGGSYETEAVVRDLAIPGVSNRFTLEEYTRDLEANRPALIIVRDLAPVQTIAVRGYLERHRNDYSAWNFGSVQLWVAKR